jgi:hypothetical protein
MYTAREMPWRIVWWTRGRMHSIPLKTGKDARHLFGALLTSAGVLKISTFRFKETDEDGGTIWERKQHWESARHVTVAEGP